MRLIFAAALAAVMLGALTAYWLNSPDSLPVIETGEIPAGIGDKKPRVKGLSYTQVTDGVRQWTLSAKDARLDPATNGVTLYNVKVIFYPKSGGWVTLEGREGTYDQKKKVVILRGKVKGVRHDGLTLTTEILTYRDKEKRVETDRFVTIEGERFKVSGMGMIVYVPKNKIVFLSQVDSVFIPVGKGPPPGATMDAPKAGKP